MTAIEDRDRRPLGFRRPAAARATPDVVAQARADARTRVLVLDGDRAPFADDERVLWCSPDVAGAADQWALLGEFEDGTTALVALASEEMTTPLAAEAGWRSLRRSGHLLDVDDAAALVTAVSLGRWLSEAAYCPACGALTDIVDAGWSRRCPSCGRQHFPRTDPAVIVAVTSVDDPDRLLLGSNVLWEPNRFSCFAGFVEAGESAEDAVRRELREECGIRVDEMSYRGSQAWPFPRSFMLGFLARGIDDADALADGEEIREVRWFSRAELRAAFAGESDVILPGGASISHALIRGWCDDE